MSGAVHPWTAPVALALVLAGVWWLATVDSLVRARVAGAGWRAVALAPVYPLRSGLRLLLKETRSTEVPDSPLWRAAPVLLIGAVLAAFAVMPLAPDLIGPDLSVGVVYVTAMLALVMVAVFAAGLAPTPSIR
jgi:NADH:ubiquinone oxidoreductase subunit H